MKQEDAKILFVKEKPQRKLIPLYSQQECIWPFCIFKWRTFSDMDTKHSSAYWVKQQCCIISMCDCL